MQQIRRPAQADVVAAEAYTARTVNDSPDNGLALTRDADWMFDKGLWTVDSRRIWVSAEPVKTSANVRCGLRDH